MFYLDGLSLSKITDELNKELVGKSINKVTQTSSLAISLNFGKTTFIFSCFPTFPICYISNSKEENFLEETTSFSLNLKKYINGSTLLKLEQLELDRILIFTFSKLNELGEVKVYKLFFEIMGKHSNLILTDGKNSIIDSLKRFSLEENSARALFNGAPYTPPLFESKISPFEVDENLFNELKSKNEFIKKVQGVGKFLIDKFENFNVFKEILTSNITPSLFIDENEGIILGSVLKIEPKTFHKKLEFSSYRELINEYIKRNSLSTSFKVLKTKLENCIKKEIKKTEKIISSINKELEEKKDFNRYKELGDILASSLYSIKKGASSVEVYDFYNDSMCKIPLNPLFTPQKNLEMLYKKYNKLKKGMEVNSERLALMKSNLLYFIGVNSQIESSKELSNLKLIEEELISEKLLKAKVTKGNKKKKVTHVSFAEENINGVPIKYGRNNTENDFLTNRFAHKEDIWFHCKDIPGAHVIVDHSITLKDEDIYEIAKFCAKLSKLPVGTKLSVDYTKVKNLNKPKGGKPGFVTYRVFDTILVQI